jgi:hypothetical protein
MLVRTPELWSSACNWLAKPAAYLILRQAYE